MRKYIPEKVIVGEDKEREPVYYHNFKHELNDDMKDSMNNINDLFEEYETMFPY
jgi:hypothetical protein